MTSFPMSVEETLDVEWRQLGPHLWVGRLDGKPLGTIEQGARWTFTDVDGHVVRDLGSLQEAQRAAVQPWAPRMAARARRRRTRLLAVRISVGVVAVGTSLLAAAGIALLVG